MGTYEGAGGLRGGLPFLPGCHRPSDNGPSPALCGARGHIEPEHLDDLRKAGADAVLAKVKSPPVIVEELRRLAGGQAAPERDDRGS